MDPYEWSIDDLIAFWNAFLAADASATKQEILDAVIK